MKEELDYYTLKYVVKLNLAASLRQGSRIAPWYHPHTSGCFKAASDARHTYFPERGTAVSLLQESAGRTKQRCRWAGSRT